MEQQVSFSTNLPHYVGVEADHLHRFGVVVLVEEHQLHAGGVAREDRDTDPLGIRRGARRVGSAPSNRYGLVAGAARGCRDAGRRGAGPS